MALRPGRGSMTGERYSASQIIESWLFYQIADATIRAEALDEAREYVDMKLASFRFLLADIQGSSGAATNLVPREDLYGSESVEEPQPEEVPPSTPEDTMTKTAAIEQAMGGDSLTAKEIWVRLRAVGYDPGTEHSVRSLLYMRRDHFSRIRPGVWRAVPEPRPVDRGRTGAAPTNGGTVEEPAPTKRCPKCGEVKALELFGKKAKGKDGLRPTCRDCASQYKRDYRAKVAEQRPEPESGATKRCPRCGEVKALELFGKNVTRKDGKAGQCRVCYGKYYRDRFQAPALAAAEPESAPLPSEDNPADRSAHTETFPTHPGNCVRCDSRMSTDGEYMVCIACGWEDYGKPEAKLVREGTRKTNSG